MVLEELNWCKNVACYKQLISNLQVKNLLVYIAKKCITGLWVIDNLAKMVNFFLSPQGDLIITLGSCSQLESEWAVLSKIS